MPTETLNNIVSLISLSAKKCFLKKAVFSKSDDKSIKRAVATLFLKGETVHLQFEYFTADNKALHKNFSIEDRLAIAEASASFSQINLIGDGAETEYKRSKKRQRNHYR